MQIVKTFTKTKCFSFFQFENVFLSKRLQKALIFVIIHKRAGMAQSVEQLIRNQQAAGSNPATSSKRQANLLVFFF